MDKTDLLKKKLDEVLASKVDELRLLGYEEVSKDEVWDCVTSKYKGEWPPLHRLVNDIYGLKATDLMNWLTVGAYQGTIDFGKNSLL
ncbi:hypothetical protein J2S00_002313 [Caldalkalibacillus uzonensis]|uniref:Post-transcriptional regulator n=1 Tax=Caldalkalibacillus uzonensis TaxID=353224 RepID=A0ABU0CVH3_9BACI|nr:post-transcriptional regulator [Caldalkalibacillus uzonensis]MDQ0339525.1 hypothetical protein [Caldalkalibacillus uzonensis]